MGDRLKLKGIDKENRWQDNPDADKANERIKKIEDKIFNSGCFGADMRTESKTLNQQLTSTQNVLAY